MGTAEENGKDDDPGRTDNIHRRREKASMLEEEDQAFLSSV